MNTNCIVIVSEKERKDIPKFEGEVRVELNPTKNSLCVCFQHNVTNADLNSFDALLKKKKPALLYFSGTSIGQIEKLALRAKAKLPNLKILSDSTTTSTRVQIEQLQRLTYEALEPHLVPTQQLAVAV